MHGDECLTAQRNSRALFARPITLFVSAHGTRKHLINFYNCHATPQLAEGEN
jgi:hypothetical protein